MVYGIILVFLLCREINYNTPTMWKICADGHHLSSGPYSADTRIKMGCWCLQARTEMFDFVNITKQVKNGRPDDFYKLIL